MTRRENDPRSILIGLLSLTVVTFVGIGVANPDVLSFASLRSTGFPRPDVGLRALAVLPTMVAGGIDLSVVSGANLTSIVAALMLKGDCGRAALPIALLAETSCRLLIGVARLPPILARFGTSRLVGDPRPLDAAHARRRADLTSPAQEASA